MRMDEITPEFKVRLHDIRRSWHATDSAMADAINAVTKAAQAPDADPVLVQCYALFDWLSEHHMEHHMYEMANGLEFPRMGKQERH